MSENTNKTKESLVRELFKLGAHFSFARARQHPSAGNFIFGYKNRHAVIDLEKTADSMDKAKDFVKSVGATSGTLLFVGTKNEARDALTAAASRIGMPFVVLHWVGGTLTNFKNIRRRIDRLAEIEEAAWTGELEQKYTKKERLVIEKERVDLVRMFGNLADLTKLPQVMVVVDSGAEAIAVTEARKVGMPVVALSGTDCDLKQVDYPVVGNDSSTPTIKWFLDEIASAYTAGKMEQKEVKEVKEVK